MNQAGVLHTGIFIGFICYEAKLEQKEQVSRLERHIVGISLVNLSFCGMPGRLVAEVELPVAYHT